MKTFFIPAAVALSIAGAAHALPGHVFARTEQPPPRPSGTCGSLALALPLLSIRSPTDNAVTKSAFSSDFAGVGVGYVLSMSGCRRATSLGFHLLAYSEAFNPSGDLQIGTGAGLGFTFLHGFYLGAGFGWDAFRQQSTPSGRQRTGYLTLHDAGHQSFAWMLTLALLPGRFLP